MRSSTCTPYFLTQCIESSFHHKERPLLSFEHVFAAVQIAHSYGMGDIAQQGVDALKEYYSGYCSGYERPSFKRHFADLAEVHAIGAIYLARLTNNPSIIPVAMLICCGIDLMTVLTGWIREDGSIVRLSNDDIIRFLVGRDTLAERAASEYLKILACGPHPDCWQVTTCKEKVANADASFSSSFNASVQGRQIVSSINAATDIIVRKLDPCTRCQDYVRAFGVRRRREVWNDLPGIFDVEVNGWSVFPS